MKRKYYFLFFLFITNFCAKLIAQTKKLDSLITITQKGKPEQQVEALTAICNLLMYDKPQEAKLYAIKAIDLANNINYKPGLGDAFNRLGIVYDISGKYDSSIFFYEKALVVYNDIKNLKGRGSAINNLGLIYWNKADYDKALTYFFDALKDFETIKNDQFTANALNNIGMVYYDIKKYQQSLQYHFKAKVVYEKLNDPYLLGAVCSNLGNVYTNMIRYDSAEYYFRLAIKKQLEAKDDYGLSIAYNGFAGILSDKKEYDSALKYFDKALVIKKDLEEHIGESSIYTQMATVYKKINNKVLELKYLNLAKDVAEQNGFNKDLISIYSYLSTYYEKSDVSLSLSFLKKHNAVKDSVFNETSNKQITELNTKYETSKKEQQLILQQVEIANKNYLVWAITCGTLLLTIAAFSFYRKKQAQNKMNLNVEVMRQQDIATKGIIVAEEKERKRIAADLHDGVGQMMSVAKMNLSAFENELPFKNEMQKNNFEKIINLVDESCKEIRSVSHQMMPNALLKSGLANAIKEFIDKLDSRILKVNLYTEGLNERLDSNIETVLYRIIQECVNNVIKHSGANTLDISLIKDTDGIAATIEDNGSGFDIKNKEKFEGIGLKNIISRVQFLKGTVDFDSSVGNGTLVAIHIPFI